MTPCSQNFSARKLLTFFMLVTGFGLGVSEAATRLTYYSAERKPVAIYWPQTSFPISYFVDRNLPARSPAAGNAIPIAFTSWSNHGSVVEFRDGGIATAPAGRDGRNSVSISDNLFGDSGFMAYTTNWFEDDGRILEADIQIDGSMLNGGVNLEALIQHEIGHLLGLDHSAVISAVMYPYVGEVDMGGLDSDDRIAISTIYPKDPQNAGHALRGEVRDMNGGVFGAQVVALNHDGSPVATGLTNAAGQFELTGLPEGQYTLYAEPLDGPVEASNMSGVWRDGRTGFRTQFLGGQSFKVQADHVQAHVVLQIDSRPSGLNPRWVGAFPTNSSDIVLSAIPSQITPGETITIAVGGDGFLSGVTSFEVLGEGVSRVSDFKYGPNYLFANFQIAKDIPATSLVIRVSNGDEATALTGALRVESARWRRAIRG